MDDLLPRHVQGRVEDLLNVFPAVELIGARQVGKSTLAAMIVEAADRPARLLTLDDAETREAATADPRGFLALEPEGLLVIDEFQRVPGLALALKAVVDSDPPPRRVPPTCQEAIRAGHHGRPPRPTALKDPSHHTRETQAEIANANQSIGPSSSHPGNALGRTRNNLPVRRRAVRCASFPLLRLLTLHCTRKRGASEGEGAQQTPPGPRAPSETWSRPATPSET